MRKLNKKGQSIFSTMGGLAIGIAVVAVVLVICFVMMAKVKTQIEADDTTVPDMGDNNGTMAWNATREMQEATFSLVGWVALVVIVAIGILILGLVRQIRAQ